VTIASAYHRAINPPQRGHVKIPPPYSHEVRGSHAILFEPQAAVEDARQLRSLMNQRFVDVADDI
jgi:hypothetical protein